MDMNQMMRQAQKMQKKLLQAQEEAAELETTTTSGGGMITVTVTGDLEFKEIVIDPEAVDPDDVEMLQDLVCAAVNEGIRAAQEMAAQHVNDVTGGMNIPGMPGM